jgi:hypothetical protein
MLSVVKIVNATRGWYEQGAAVQRLAGATAPVGRARPATPPRPAGGPP